jgi:hypothetical protein
MLFTKVISLGPRSSGISTQAASVSSKRVEEDCTFGILQQKDSAFGKRVDEVDIYM